MRFAAGREKQTQGTWSARDTAEYVGGEGGWACEVTEVKAKVTSADPASSSLLHVVVVGRARRGGGAYGKIVTWHILQKSESHDVTETTPFRRC